MIKNSTSVLNNIIFETDSLAEIANHLSPNTMLFCDLDNTLMEANQHFGSVQWGDNYFEDLILAGETPENADNLLHQLWLKFLPNMTMRLIDEQGPDIIKQIQQNGYQVFGLTARFPVEAWYTHPHLEKFKISFERGYPDQELALRPSVKFEKGILFCSTRHQKSAVLLAFLKHYQISPKKIIFIDDKLSHVQDIANALANTDIEFVGIRYSKVDPRVKEFNKALAELQWKSFPHFLSDEDALKMLSTSTVLSKSLQVSLQAKGSESGDKIS